jgi:hypothetical protein
MQRLKLITFSILITLAAPAFAAAAQRPLHVVIGYPRDARQDAMKKETVGSLLTSLQSEPGEAILISYGMQIYHEGRVSLAKGAEAAAAVDRLREAPRSKLDLAVAVRGATSRAVIAAGANDRAAVVLLGAPGADYRKLPLAEVLKLAGMPTNSPVLEGGLRLPLFLVTIDPKAKGISSASAGPLTIITTGATAAERNAAIARVAAVVHKAPTLIPEAATPTPVNVPPPPQQATKATSRLPLLVLGALIVAFAALVSWFMVRRRRRAAEVAARAMSLASDASPTGPVPLRHLAAAPKPRMFQLEITVGRQAPHTIPLMLPAAGSALSFDIPGTVVDVESLPPGVARLTVSGSGNCAIAVLTDEVPVRLGRHVLPPDAEYRLPPEEKLYLGNELSLSVSFRAAERETARPAADPIQAAFGR